MVAIKPLDDLPPERTGAIQRGLSSNANPSMDQGIVDTPLVSEGGVEQGGPKQVADKPGTGMFDAFPKVTPQAADPAEAGKGMFDAFPKVEGSAFDAFKQVHPSAEPGIINQSPANYEDRMAAGSALQQSVTALAAARDYIAPEIKKQAQGAWDTVAGGYADSHSDDFWKRLMAPLKMGMGAVAAGSMWFTVPQAKVGQALEKATGGLLTEDNLSTAMWGLRPIGGHTPLVDGGAGITSRLETDPATGAMKGGPIGTFPPHPQEFQNAATAIAAQGEEKVTSAAMRDGEHIAMGTNHAAAAQALDDAGHNGFGGERGYTTTHRDFVPEEEATKIAENQGQIKPGGRTPEEEEKVRAAGFTVRPGPKSEDINMHNPEAAKTTVETNLLHAWNEGGVHPAEVAADAKGNPALIRDLSAARTPSLPLPPRPSKVYLSEFDDTLNRLRGAHTADQSEFLNLTRRMPEGLMTPEIQGEWYKHAEGDPTANMTPSAGDAYNKYMVPLKQEEARLFEEVSKSQLDLGQGDFDPGYMHRMVKGKTPEIDRLAGEGGEQANPIYNGSGLMARTTSSMNERRYFVAENTAGERRVVSIKGNELRTVGKQEPGNDLSYSKADEMNPKKPGADLRKGDSFPDANGDKWEIKNAYTREIEGATSQRYYQNALANTIDNIMHLRAASRAIYAVEQMRSTPEWAQYTQHGHGPGAGIGDNGGPLLDHMDEAVEHAKPTAEARVGSDWIHPEMPLFRNDLMDPKLANIIDDFWGQRGSDGLSVALAKINNFAVSSMFLTPVPHAHNAGVHWTLDRSWDWITPGGLKSLAVNGASAMREVWTQGPIYQELMRNGSGLLYGKIANHDFYSQLLQSTGMALMKNPEEVSALEKILNMSGGGLIKGMYNASAKALWMTSDMFMVQRVLELKNLHGMDTRAAIAEAERFMPNYRVPSEMFGSRSVQQVYTNPMAFEFSRYHWGVLKGLGNLAKDMAVGTMDQRSHAIGSAMAAGVLMLAVYPAMNELLQKVTGMKDLHLGPGGPLRLAEPLVAGAIKATSNLWSKETKDYYKNSPGMLDRMTSLLSIAPVAKGLAETYPFNKYSFSGRNIAEPGDVAKGRWGRVAGQEAEHAAQTIVSPYDALNAAVRNGESPAEAITKFTFGLSEHTNDQEMRKQKALHWNEHSANKRANKGGLGMIEKMMGGK